MEPKTLDHVALWVAGRDAIADACTSQLGMHVIDRTDRFTLLGADARRGKLTLFAAEGPREQGLLRHVGLRVSSGGGGRVELGEGLEVVLVEAPTEVEYDLDHVALAVSDPEAAAGELERFGLRRDDRDGVPRVEVGGAYVELHRADGPTASDRPLLNHLGLLVDSAEAHIERARELGLEIEDVVDAANTYAVFVTGPEGLRLEYVEHKPTFSLT